MVSFQLLVVCSCDILPASYTSGLRPHTLVGEGLIHELGDGPIPEGLIN
jgi:hypothetical protein